MDPELRHLLVAVDLIVPERPATIFICRPQHLDAKPDFGKAHAPGHRLLGANRERHQRRLQDQAPGRSLSRHLALMRHLGLVECRREGRWVHYRLCPEDGCAGLAEWLVGLAAREPQLVEDARRLAAFEPTDCGRPACATRDADMEASAR